jgi:hypothetical protein
MQVHPAMSTPAPGDVLKDLALPPPEVELHPALRSLGGAW